MNNNYERPPKEMWRQPKPTKAEARKLYKVFGGTNRNGDFNRAYAVIEKAYKEAFPNEY